MECESHWTQPFGVHMHQEIITNEKGTVVSRKKSNKWIKPPGTTEKVEIDEEEKDNG